MRKGFLVLLVTLLVPGLAPAQEADGPPDDGDCPCAAGPGPGGGPGHGRGGGPMGMGPGGLGAFWKNPEVVKALDLSDAQADTIRAAFRDHRRRLVDLRAALEKAELAVQETLDAYRVDTDRAQAQAEAVIAARGALGREFAQMFLKVRTTLTRAQWDKLRELRPPRPGGPGRGFRGPGPRD